MTQPGAAYAFSVRPSALADFATLVAICAVAACSDPERPVLVIPPGGLTISPSLRSLAVGDTFRLSSVVTGTNTPPTGASWHSSRPSVATVDPNGLVTAVAVGTTQLTVSDSTANDTLTLSIVAGFVSVIAGDTYDCAIDVNGAVGCWATGSLGSSVLTNDTLVPGGHVFTSLSAGSHHICGITADSSGYCWGENFYGLFGNGDTSFTWTPTPTPISGNHKFTALSAGPGVTSCAIAASGVALCWGNGNLGIPPDDSVSLVPQAVSGGLVASSVATGYQGACLVTTSHSIDCWGNNGTGQLAAVTDTSILSPVDVSAPTTFTAVTAGQPACAIGTDGKTYCWGEIDFDFAGPLYGERPLARNGPSLVAISSSNGNDCGLTGAGAAYCLGDDELGQIGNGQVSSDAVAIDPVAVLGGLVFSQVTTGNDYACGIAADSAAYCWGDPYSGQLGTGARSGPAVTSPVAVLGGNKFRQVSGGYDYTCGVTTAGALLCWGTLHGVFDSLPTAVDTTHTFTQVSNGLGSEEVTQCAIAADSSAYCWGSDFYGALGNGASGVAAYSATPVPVSGGHKFLQVTVGANHACGIISGGAAYCWGLGAVGALGTGDTSSSSIPVAVTGGHTFASISAGLTHSCGVTTAGALYCWGRNDEYQLGLGYGGENAAVPIAAGGSVQAQAVSAGNGFFCALGTDQLAYCWGYNQQGQLGRGDSTFTHGTPAPVVGGHQFTQLVSSGEQSCGLTGAGQAYCWGNRVLSPQAQQGAVRFQSISVGSGGDHVCGVTTAREVLCWSTPVPPAPPTRRSLKR